jgi:hypothetical protein
MVRERYPAASYQRNVADGTAGLSVVPLLSILGVHGVQVINGHLFTSARINLSSSTQQIKDVRALLALYRHENLGGMRWLHVSHYVSNVYAGCRDMMLAY